MKICIIGNSHVGALKLGWESLPERPAGLALSFYAAIAQQMGDLRIEGGRLVPSTRELARAMAFTSGGESAIDPSGFDAFLVYGLRFDVPRALDRRLSRAVLDAACRDSYATSTNHAVATRLRQLTQAPLFVGHNPLPAEPDVPCGEHALGYPETLAHIAAVAGDATLRFVPQPLRTLSGPWDTAMEFSKGSKRLEVSPGTVDVLHPGDDTRHMNAGFGRAWLTDFFATLTAPCEAVA